MASTGSRSSAASAAPTSVPSSMRPFASMSVGWAMMKTSLSDSRRYASAASTAARSSSRSCWVSMMRASTPPSTSPRACSKKMRSRASAVTLESTGSDAEGSIPVGPIDPATNRGWSEVAWRSAARRASRAARKFTS